MAVKAPVEPPVEADDQSLAKEWMKTRGISPQTMDKCSVEQCVRWFREVQAEAAGVSFPYMQRDAIPYAWKCRALDFKDFSAAGSPQSLWLHHLIDDWSEIVICEGEMDAMSAMEAGVKNPTSLPCGAMNPEEKQHDRRFRWCDNHHEKLGESTRVVLALDSDLPGKVTSKEIARRLGADKVWLAVYPDDCKDLNDVLVKHGAQAVADAVTGAIPYPVEGAISDDDAITEAQMVRDGGEPKGEGTGFLDVDNIYSIPEGKLTVVTGHPGSGKSQFLDNIMLNLADSKGWRFGMVTFENSAGAHMNELMHMWLGKSPYPGKYNQASDYEVEQSQKFVSQHFKWMNTSGDELVTLERIISVLKHWVLRYGIRGAVIDPYNYVGRDKDASETDWISHMLTRIRQFCQTYGVHVWFVAHPTKMTSHDDKLPVPTGYSISGSAAWYAKADLGLTVHRPTPGQQNERTEVHVWKAKRKWMGALGNVDVWYSPDAHRYCDISQNPRVQTLKEPTPF